MEDVFQHRLTNEDGEMYCSCGKQMREFGYACWVQRNELITAGARGEDDGPWVVRGVSARLLERHLNAMTEAGYALNAVLPAKPSGDLHDFEVIWKMIPHGRADVRHRMANSWLAENAQEKRETGPQIAVAIDETDTLLANWTNRFPNER